jgi:hypothetical protein
MHSIKRVYIDTFLFIHNNFQIKKHVASASSNITVVMVLKIKQVLDRSKQVKLSMFLLALLLFLSGFFM